MARALVLLLLLVGAASPASADAPKHGCIVKGSSVTLEKVSVQPVGDTAIELGLVDVPVEARLPTRCGAPLDLQIRGSLAFRAKRDQVWLTIARDITSSDGLVSARKGAHVIDACVRGDRVIASAVTYSDDVLEGEAKPADEIVTPFDIPCDALVLDSIALPDDAVLAMGSSVNDHYWELRGEASTISLYAAPRAGSSRRTLESPSCVGCIQLRELTVKTDWVEVETSGEGVTATGWVRRSAVKRIPDDTLAGHGYMCSGNHGAGGWGESPVIGSIEREAIVAAGTHVFTGYGTGRWGTFVVDTKVKVRIHPGTPWAELRQVPGLDGDPSGSPFLHGEVPLDSVKLVTAKP